MSMTPPNVANYDIGGHICELGGVDLGAIEDIQLDPQIETLEHFSRRTGKRVLDLQLLTQVQIFCTLTLSEHAVENYRHYFMSVAAGNVISLASAPLAETTIELTYVSRTGTPRWILTHTKAQTRPASPMTFGDGTQLATYQLQVSLLEDLQDDHPHGKLEFVAS